MLPQIATIIALALSICFLVGAFIITRFSTINFAHLLFLFFAVATGYIVWDSGLFPYWWVGLLISATLTCMAVVFIWGLNRFSYRSFLVRAYAGGLLSIFSWISATGIMIRKYMGWGVSVPLISEDTIGDDWENNPEIRQQVSQLQEDAEAGGEGEAAVDTQQSWIRSAIAAIPDQADREEATGLLLQNLTDDVMAYLVRLGLARRNTARGQRLVRRREQRQAQEGVRIMAQRQGRTWYEPPEQAQPLLQQEQGEGEQEQEQEQEPPQ